MGGREDLSEYREWSKGRPGGPAMVGRSSRRDASGQEALPEEWQWSVRPHGGSGGPRGGSGAVGRPSWRVGSGREALSEGR